MTDLDDQALALFPIDGPHSPETTIAAARTIAGLVRYLNHATQRQHALEYPSDLDSVIANLHAATVGAQQLVRQLADHAARFGQDVRLYDDHGANPALTVADVIGGLRTAAAALAEVAHPLDHAHQACNRLGVRD